MAYTIMTHYFEKFNGVTSKINDTVYTQQISFKKTSHLDKKTRKYMRQQFKKQLLKSHFHLWSKFKISQNTQQIYP